MHVMFIPLVHPPKRGRQAAAVAYMEDKSTINVCRLKFDILEQQMNYLRALITCITTVVLLPSGLRGQEGSVGSMVFPKFQTLVFLKNPLTQNSPLLSKTIY